LTINTNTAKMVQEIIIVEAVKLDHDIQAGIYSLHCLPLRLPTSDGSPSKMYSHQMIFYMYVLYCCKRYSITVTVTL